MKEEHETRNYNGVFHSNSAELYSWAKAIIVSFLCTRGGRRKMRRKKRRWRRRRGGGERRRRRNQNSNAVFRSNAAQFTHGPRLLSLTFLTEKSGRGGRGGGGGD